MAQSIFGQPRFPLSSAAWPKKKTYIACKSKWGVPKWIECEPKYEPKSVGFYILVSKIIKKKNSKKLK